jgi:uracil-DNA glycosylase
VSLCSPWLDGVIALLSPRLIMPVGGLAISRFLPGRSLDQVVGGAYSADGMASDEEAPPIAPILVPLPHPSGQSRWLNDAPRARRLDSALQLLAPLIRWAEEPGGAML